MPIFDAKDLDTDLEGEAMLAQLLYPSPQARSCAQARGRIRAKRGGMATGGAAIQTNPAGPTELEPAVAPAD